MIEARLEVSGKDVREAARYLAKTAKHSEGGEVLLTFDDGDLVLEVLGTAYRIPAKGEWPGVCRAGRGVVGLLARAPTGDFSIVVMETGHLHVGDSSVECCWDDVAGERIELPVNPTALDILGAAFRSPPDVIAASGMTELVLKAEQERRDRVRRAAEILKPFGNCHELIDRWVEGRIRGEYDYLQH